MWPIDGNVSYMALTSLFSWNFVTLPEHSFDIQTTFVNLGTAPGGLGLLRLPDPVLNSIDFSSTSGARLKLRLQDGYTMTKYRTATGEETAAIYRGPLTPTLVPYPLTPGLAARTQLKSCWLSNSGIDLQIMDPVAGVMDVTYSVAWQLGKTLAVSDQLFTAALGRLRSAIFGGGMNGSKVAVLRQRGLFESRQGAVDRLTKTLSSLNTLHKKSPGLYGTGGSMLDRWQRPQSSRLDLSYFGELIQDVFDEHAWKTDQKLMLSSEGDFSVLYDELNTASSPDWAIVLKWVLDKMYLYDVPAHYLITDPSYLPQESLRFFHVDRNWTDALIDGALSLGNHLSGTDKVRLAIHKMIEDYLSPASPSSAKTMTPPKQVPLYGFMMHSEAVTKYPDLKVDIKISQSGSATEETTAILRQENLDATKGVMLCLLDQLPGSPGLESITFTEPPHQQSFIAGAELDSKKIKATYKQIFTAPDQEPNPTPWATYTWSAPQSPSVTVNGDTSSVGDAKNTDENEDPIQHPQSVFKWTGSNNLDVRTLLPTSWAFDVSTVLNFYGADGAKYVDSTPNAAMAGIQLNNPVYRLKIAIPSAREDSSQQQRVGPKIKTTSKEASASFPPVEAAATLEPKPGHEPEQKGLSLLPKPGRASNIRSGTQGTSKPPARVGSGFELGPSHGYESLVPPYYHRTITVDQQLPPLPKPAKPTRPARAAPGPITPPIYNITVLPIDNNPESPGIPAGTGIPKDLVFAITVANDTQSPAKPTTSPSRTTPASDGFNLKEMKLLLQLNVKPGDAPNCLLAGNYAGPGPFMTSNVRFFVQAQIQPPTSVDRNTYLALRILPRSTNGWATFEMYQNLTFILPVCIIGEHRPGARLLMYVIPIYDGRDPTPLANYTAIVIQ